MKKMLLSLVAAAVMLATCNRADDPVNSAPEAPSIQKTGKVTGKVMANNGVKPIGGALVFTFDGNHKLYYAYSDAQGNFALDAPEGQRTIHIQTGGGSNFRTEVTANISETQPLVLSASQTKLTQIANIAYVKGAYDKIEDIITGLGYTATQLSFSQLQDMNNVAPYDIIFLNCGSRNSQAASGYALAETNLANFVTNGGSLYASDWDVSYLVGGGANSTACNLPGGFIADPLLCSQNNGMSGTYSNCNVSNTALASAIGFNSLDIDYDLGSWQKINSYDASFWDVLVEKQGEALMIRTNKFVQQGAPTIAVGNAANNQYVTICHKPAGANPVTLTIPQNALSAHLAHGDSLGSCNGTSNSGNIYFTTFHNHASGNIGNTAPILQYVILNL